MLTFQPITLDVTHGDEEALLVLRSERLLAVLTRLSTHHNEAAGDWFVEVVFNDALPIAGRRCKSLSDVTVLIEGG